MAKNAEGVALGFRELSYVVKVKGGTKNILSNVSGTCHPGRVMAIMGPSGAGKTSLLDILAGRKARSGGDICLGHKANPTSLDIQRVSAYVQQDDAIMASQTVREALTMASELTLPGNASAQVRKDRAEALLETFKLTGCADTCVGDPVGQIKGISGGERKRLAVAMCTVREPPILFLDEPTSGLDAYKAYMLVKTLKNLTSEQSMTVVCTIHQPSSDIYALFDDLMLLLDGRVVYAGPAGDAVTHFGNSGFVCPTYANPADYFFMHVLTCEGDTDNSQTNKLLEAWQGAEQKDSEAVEALFRAASQPTLETSKVTQSTGAPWSRQFVVLFRRAVNNLRRNPLAGKAKLGEAIVFGIIIALIWFRVDNDQNGLQDRSGALFFICANGMMQNVMGTLTTFSNERSAVLREQENSMYHTAPYFVSKLMVELPVKIICPAVFGCIAYWAVGFQPLADKFLVCLVCLVLLAMAGGAIGLFLACIFPDIAIALIVAPMIVLPLMMFSGFFLNPESTPVYLGWVEWISPMKYAFAVLAQNEFSGLDLHCTADQLRKLIAQDNTVVEVCPVPSGDHFLATLNIQSVLTIENCLLLLVVLTGAFTTLAYFGLLAISHRVRAKSRVQGVPMSASGKDA